MHNDTHLHTHNQSHDRPTEDVTLSRDLGLFSITMIGVGGMIGATRPPVGLRAYEYLGQQERWPSWRWPGRFSRLALAR